jgi:hypothetical protein
VRGWRDVSGMRNGAPASGGEPARAPGRPAGSSLEALLQASCVLHRFPFSILWI